MRALFAAAAALVALAGCAQLEATRDAVGGALSLDARYAEATASLAAVPFQDTERLVVGDALLALADVRELVLRGDVISAAVTDDLLAKVSTEYETVKTTYLGYVERVGGEPDAELVAFDADARELYARVESVLEGKETAAARLAAVREVLVFALTGMRFMYGVPI